jgi:hypothetical protein
MLEEMTKVNCPVCEGEGELSPATIVEKFVNAEERARFDARIEEIMKIYNSEPMATKATVLNFQKEVHNWNPALPIWRRSPKE